MVERATDIESADRARRAAALNAALGRLARITPELCVDYLKALAVDQERWQRHIQAIRQQPRLRREPALHSLARTGGKPLTWYARNATSLQRRRTAFRMRPVQARELQAAILSPPPALVPRVITAARRRTVPRRLRRVAAPSHAPHALEALEVALASKQGQAEGDGHGH
jgi:hypothetical protein